MLFRSSTLLLFKLSGNEPHEAYSQVYILISVARRNKYFRGDKIDCPMRLYRPELVADLAKKTTDRWERAKIARAAGYTVKFIEGMLRKRRDEEEPE